MFEFEVEPTDTRVTPADAVLMMLTALRGADEFSPTGDESDTSQDIALGVLAKLSPGNLVRIIQFMTNQLVRLGGAEDEPALDLYEAIATKIEG